MSLIFEQYESNRIHNIVSAQNTPLEILKKYKSHESSMVRSEIARHPNVDLETLDFLTQDDDYEVLYAITLNLKTTSELLNKLLETKEFNLDKEIDTRLIRGIAYHSNSTPDILEDISNRFDDEDVNRAICASPNISLSLLEKYSRNNSAWVRFTVVKHPKCSDEILKVMAEDSHSTISEVAKERLELLVN